MTRESELTSLPRACPERVPGVDVMRKAVVGAEYTRKLVRVDASSIKWYGVAVPSFCQRIEQHDMPLTISLQTSFVIQ